MFWRYRGIFNKRQWALLTLHIAQKAHRAFAHAVNRADLLTAFGQGIAQSRDRGILVQVTRKGVYLLGQRRRVVVAKLDQVDTPNWCAALGEELGHAVPHKIGHGEREHRIVDGFDRHRPGAGHQRFGIAQRIHKAGIAHVNQGGVLRDGQYAQHGFVQKPQRAFRATQQAVEIKRMLVVAQVSQVVTGQAAVKRRKGGLNQIALLINNTGRCAVHLPNNTVLLAGLLFLIGTECPAMQMLATQQYRVEFPYVVTGFSVSTATLTAGIS